MTPPRPSRYRVVERGRRLEVIDTWKQGAAPRTVASPRPPSANRAELGSARAAPRDWRASVREMAAESARQNRGRRVITTRGWYDARGPRPIVLTHEGEARLRGLRFMAWVVGAILAVLFLTFPPFAALSLFLMILRRGAIRQGIASYLEKINQPIDAISGDSDG